MLLTMAGLYTSARWRALRLQILARDGWRCTKCGRSVARPGEARIDHIIRVKDDPRFTFDPTNLRVLCASCDNRSHAEKRLRLPYRVERTLHGTDVHGLPCDPDHLWRK
jgi:5-methylcytosine-specific restriction endonuclease McrA